jgi:hypothetical protein
MALDVPNVATEVALYVVAADVTDSAVVIPAVTAVLASVYFTVLHLRLVALV